MIQISGRGSLDARVMLIGDGGSESDITSGLALSGDQERELRALAGALNLRSFSFDEFWKTCLIKERINLKFPDMNKELITDNYKKILCDEINTIKPNVLVPLSELSFNTLTGLRGIRKFRGSVLPPTTDFPLYRSDLRVIPVLGPNPYLYEDPKMKFISRLDFGKVARNQYTVDPIREIGNVWICETAQALRAFLDRQWPTAKFLAFDIETYANIPTCISFCFDGLESVCIPILDYKISLDSRVMMLDLVLKVLASDIPKVNQNIKFDWRKLNRLGWKVNNVIGDTMLAQSLLYCEFPKNLGFLTSIYTDMPYFKDEGKEFDLAKYDRKKLYTYNAKDSLATHQIFQQQQEELKEKNLEHVSRLVFDLLPIYRQMEENGLLVDDTQRKKLLAKYWNLYAIHHKKLARFVGREVNPMSSTVMNKLVYEELQWRVVEGVKKTKGGGPSADEESLEVLMWSSECNSHLGKHILRTIIDCRHLHKCIEILELELYPDMRMRCEFNLAGAETGRTTGGAIKDLEGKTASQTTDYYLKYDKGKLKLANLGHSFQTIGKHGFTVDEVEYGKDLRTIFVPSPGYSFVECDLSQAEARVDAVLAKDYDILKVFDGPVGIHRLTGSWVFDCAPSEIKKNELTLNADGVGEDRYTIAKVVRHAAERNMQEGRLMVMIRKPKPYCGKILKRLHDNQPNIKRVFHADVREAVRGRALVAPNGRRRDFFGRIDDKAVNEGISQLPQSIVTDYLKEGIRKTMNELDWVRGISEAHDGFLTEVPKGRELEYGETFKRNVEQPIDFRTCTLSRDFELTIPCEVEWSDTNWKEMKGLLK